MTSKWNNGEHKFLQALDFVTVELVTLFQATFVQVCVVKNTMVIKSRCKVQYLLNISL